MAGSGCDRAAVGGESRSSAATSIGADGSEYLATENRMEAGEESLKRGWQGVGRRRLRTDTLGDETGARRLRCRMS